jgi:uncharacterized membrane protein
MLIRRVAQRCLGVLAITVAVHLAVVWAVPRVMMWKLFDSLERTAGGAPGMQPPFFPPLADATARRVVMPNPDLLYGLCVLDLERGPVIVRADPKLSTYWSIALYSSNSDHFFVLNDHEAGQRPVKLRISATADQPESIVAPSKKVLLLMRVLVPDRTDGMDALEAARSSLRCSTS